MKNLQAYPQSYEDCNKLFESNNKFFKRETLNYDFDSLNPFIDTETMKEHYGVHYKKYTDNLNDAVIEEKIPVDKDSNIESIKNILKNINKYSDKVKNNGGGFYNHLLYFENLSPEKKSPKGNILEAIKESFGGLPNFKKQMQESGTSLFGSGWIWLVADKNGKLSLMTSPNQNNPLMEKSFKGEIILGMDVWEHAYYLKHKADRKSYIKDFLELVDWEVAEERFNKFVK